MYLPQTKHTVVFFKFFSIITEQELCGSPGRSAPSAGIKKNVTSITLDANITTTIIQKRIETLFSKKLDMILKQHLFGNELDTYHGMIISCQLHF